MLELYKIIIISIVIICFRCRHLSIRKQLKRHELKSHGGNFGNVLEACYRETVIRKRRFQSAGSPNHKLPAHLRTEAILQSNYELLFYKTYRRNSSEYYFEFGNERRFQIAGRATKPPCTSKE